MSTTMDGSTVVTSFIHHEHEELVAGIGGLRDLASELGRLPHDSQRARVDRLLRWADTVLRPHMAWEEAWLFPQLDQRAGLGWATQLVRFDHRQIDRQVSRLASHRRRLELGASKDTVGEISADLFGLEALLRANVEREEAFLLPMLEGHGEPGVPA